MKLGLLTAPFPRRSLKQVAEWAVSEGFEMLEVACWPAAGAERRRYAGTSHIDVSKLDVGAVRGVLDRYGLEISSLAYYPNNLHSDRAERRAAHTHLRTVIDAAAKLEVGIVGTFVGRDKTKNVPDNFREVRRVWPRLVDYAESRGVKIAIENCPMIFSWDEWPGGTNLASTPAMWDEMFSIVDSPSFGLNLDPSHLVWLMIDYERVVRDYASKIFHVHAKDMEVGGPADEQAGDDVARVVHPERDPRQPDERRRREEADAGPTREREDAEGDRERSGCVVAGERGIGRRRGEQMRRRLVGCERARPVPHVGDRLVRDQGDPRGDESRHAGEPPPRDAGGPRHEPERDRRDGVERHRQ